MTTETQELIYHGQDMSSAPYAQDYLGLSIPELQEKAREQVGVLVEKISQLPDARAGLIYLLCMLELENDLADDSMPGEELAVGGFTR